MNHSSKLCAAVLSGLASLAFADPVLITSSVTISPTQTTITPTGGGPAVPLAIAEITVAGATLTINGRHTIQSLTLQRDAFDAVAVLTHDANTSWDYSGSGTDIVQGLELTVTSFVTIEGASGLLGASRFDFDAKGFPARTGDGCAVWFGGGGGGGSGHGGAGSNGSGFVGGGTYGSFTQPVTYGSGGGGNCCYSPGAGGGRLRLIVGSTLTLDGVISANGAGLIAGVNGGGASGGSLWVTCGSFAGSGSLEAKGGTGDANDWGAGGGGRIAVEFASRSFPDANIDASGGQVGRGSVRGGAGTIWLKPAGLGTLIVDNKGTGPTEATEMTGNVTISGNLLTRNGGFIGPAHADPSLALTVSGAALLQADSGMLADFRGYAARSGPGIAAWFGGGGGGGAAHGGAGSNGSGSEGGDCYDSVTQPAQMGSGGAGNCCATAGRGGGVIRLIVGGVLTVDGSISADGENFDASLSNGGGGSGGAVWINAATLDGSGSIRARGGTGSATDWGAGGGGRIAAYFNASTFPQANLDASGGATGWNNVIGGAGTVYLKPTSGLGTLIIDNHSPTAGEATELSGPNSFNASLIVDNGGYLAPKHADDTLALTFAGNALVGPLGHIGADFRGYAPRTGPGIAAWFGGGGGGGAGHGGAGSNGSGSPGGGTYGSALQPTTMGSGGAGDCCSSAGRGGGTLRLTCLGNLQVQGLISANGEDYDASRNQGGGGAGGSLWLTCASLSGNGLIEARGGSGNGPDWGGGGGGRVAAYFNSSSFPLANYNLGGAANAFQGVAGGAGTLYLKPSASRGTLVIDNDGASGETTEVSGSNHLDANLIVGGGGVLGPVQGDGSLVLAFDGDIAILADGKISADARGYAPRTGPGASSWFGGGGGGGAGHGGAGGGGTGGPPGSIYDNDLIPTDMGSGGGGNCCSSPGAGGGYIDLSSKGTIVVNGVLSANGQAPSTFVGPNTGGGSGGGLLIHAATVAGSGLIQANGADGANTFDWGGGGGGRIAIYACVLSVPGSNIQTIGGAGFHAGEPGSTVIAAATATASPSTVCRADVVTFRVVSAVDVGPYQWRFNGVPFGDGTRPSGATASGTHTPVLTLTGVSAADEGDYSCTLVGACGGVTSNAAHLFVVCCPDVNHDGNVDQDDVSYLVNVVGGGDNPSGIDPDFNSDGNVDQDDVSALINVVAGGPCP